MLQRQVITAVAWATISLAATVTKVSQLRQQGYDFIVAGGGTAGLTVADRLSEAFPDRTSSCFIFWSHAAKPHTGTVLVVEYGTIEYAPRIGGPPSNTKSASGWALPSLPNPGINNRTVSVQIGKVSDSNEDDYFLMLP